jgi:hypothetical protein
MGFFNIESGPAAKFERPGDSVTGVIASPYTERESTELGTNRPKINSQGKPVMMAVIELQTNQRDLGPDDDGLRVLYVDKYAMRKAIAAAVRDAKVDDLEVGGTLTVTFTHETPSDKGNPQKNFSAQYVKGGAASTWDQPADAVAGARAVQQGVQAARSGAVAPAQVPPPAPSQPAPNGASGLPVNQSADMAKIRELAGYGLTPAAIMSAFPDGRYTLNAITAILAIPA